MYAGEIAVNHCAPDAQKSELLDTRSTVAEPGSASYYPHVHCWHTDDTFSKHAFTRREYRREDAPDLDLTVVRDYCLEMSFRSLDDLAPPTSG